MTSPCFLYLFHVSQRPAYTLCPLLGSSPEPPAPAALVSLQPLPWMRFSPSSSRSHSLLPPSPAGSSSHSGFFERFVARFLKLFFFFFFIYPFRFLFLLSLLPVRRLLFTKPLCVYNYEHLRLIIVSIFLFLLLLRLVDVRKCNINQFLY